MHAEGVQLAIPQQTNSLLLLIQLAPGEANILQALRVIAQYKLMVYRAQFTGLLIVLTLRSFPVVDSRGGVDGGRGR